jgi:DeoR/GlpR family transcriptional regulator of sugar metabolism
MVQLAAKQGILRNGGNKIVLTAERRQYILQVLRRDGKIVAKQLSEELDLSEDTIRRDLRDLAADGALVRVHGGALPSSPPTVNADFFTRQEQKIAAKTTIAQKAAMGIHSGQVVLMDGGTTNVHVAQSLPQDLHATIITNSPPLAVALAEHAHIDVILLGGHLFKHSMVTVGVSTLEDLQRIHVDLYIMGICSIHPEVGLSSNYFEEASLQHAMMTCAADVIALVTAEKINTVAPYVIGKLEDISEIITEQSVSNQLLEPYRTIGITVTQV